VNLTKEEEDWIIRSLSDKKYDGYTAAALRDAARRSVKAQRDEKDEQCVVTMILDGFSKKQWYANDPYRSGSYSSEGNIISLTTDRGGSFTITVDKK
jgi:Mg-chelatase subunit ChlD